MSEQPLKYGINEQTSLRICEVFAHHESVEKVILFGSRATDNYRPGSDIDLAIVGTDVSFADQLKIEAELDDLMLPYTIDLLRLNTINHNKLLEHINQFGVDFYRRQK